MDFLVAFLAKLPCLRASLFASAFASPLALLTEPDWVTRLSVIFGAGGLAALIVALGRFRLASAAARKTDGDAMANQFTIIVERLQKENQALANRLETANQREALITVSKHEALKENQAMIFHIQDLTEMIGIHNMGCAKPLKLPKFNFTMLTDILRSEDEARLKFAECMTPVKTTPEIA